MITFLLCITALILGYFTYGRYVERVFVPKFNRPTPAQTERDGVDFLPMGKNRNALIQLLNIAGTGPIFGPIMGALYGPVAFVWIVIGCIFAGAVHDYLTGMISIRNCGAHLPQLVSKYLGERMKHVVNLFALLLLVLVGTVFVSSPAMLIKNEFKQYGIEIGLAVLVLIIYLYYMLSTVLPINQIIGKVYPIFGAVLLFSAVGIGIMLIIKQAPIPNLTAENIKNYHPNGIPIFPMLFFTITCGALSGFHATQSPLISRTTENEANGRYIFYGMMIAEGIIAMIWAAAAISLFHGYEHTAADGTQYIGIQAALKIGGPAYVVSEVSTTLLGGLLGTVAVIGVIVLPITSGDTSFRAARNIIADYFRYPQAKLINRLLIALPMFAISFVLTKIDFAILWRYFSWSNQTLAVLALWSGAMYLLIARKNYLIALIPAVFMTFNVFTYIFNQKIGFGMSLNLSYALGFLATLVCIYGFWYRARIMRNLPHFELDYPVNGSVTTF